MRHRVLTTPYFFDEEANLINQLFELGLPCLHLRKPKATTVAVAQLLDAIDDKYHYQIILHQDHKLALEYDLLGVHLTEETRKKHIATDSLLEFRNTFAGFELGTAIHAVDRLHQLPICFDYAFVSPVFDSISKEGYTAQHHWKASDWQDLPFDIIGLGGMNIETIPLAKQRGFSEIALLGALWSLPQQTLQNYKQLCLILQGLTP